MRRLALLLGLSLMLLPAAAVAQTIDFAGGLNGDLGWWVWSGVPNDVSGSSQDFNDIAANAIGLSGSVWTWDTTGGTSGTDAFASFSGGTINISPDSGGSYCTGTYCFTGTISSGWIAESSNGYTLIGSFVSGTVDPNLLSYLQISSPNGSFTGDFSVDLTKGGCIEGAPEGCGGTVSSLDLKLSPVPEPGTLTLLGTGLLGLAGIVRRKLKK